MTILDCASKAACGPSIDHCHGTSSRNLNAPVQVQHFALGVVEPRFSHGSLLLELNQRDVVLPLIGHRKFLYNVVQCAALCFALKGAPVISAGG